MKIPASERKAIEAEQKEAAAIVATVPHLYAEFEHLTFNRINKGFRHYGSRDVIGFIRWHTPLTEGGKSQLKVNNNLAKPFAIHFAARHPTHAKFYRHRAGGYRE